MAALSRLIFLIPILAFTQSSWGFTVDTWSVSPSSVEVGQDATLCYDSSTSAQQSLTQGGIVYVYRDGEQIFSSPFFGPDTISNPSPGLDPEICRTLSQLLGSLSLFSQPGNYELKVFVEGSEDGEPFSVLEIANLEVKEATEQPPVVDPDPEPEEPPTDERPIGEIIDDAMQDIATNPAESATAAVISNICPQGVAQERLQQDCNVLVGGSLLDPTKDQASKALGQVTSDQASVPLNASQNSVQVQGRNVVARIAALRAGARGFSVAGLNFNMNGKSIAAGNLADEFLKQLNGGAAGDAANDFGRLGIFLNGSIAFGDKDRTLTVQGFDFETKSLTLGADYRFSDQFVAGAALGYSENDSDLENGGGNIDSDGLSLSLYGSFYQDSGLYLDGILTFGNSDYDQRRNIQYNIGDVNVNQTASSDFDGDQWSISLGGGYSFTNGGLTFGPTARIEYVSAEVDGYDESMSNPTANGGGWATHIDGQDLTSFTTQIGADVSYASSQSWGVLLPQASIEWVHEFEDGSGNVNGYFLQDPTRTGFSLVTDELDSNYFNLRLGLSAQFKDGVSAFLYYRKLLGYSDLDVDAIAAGVRMEF